MAKRFEFGAINLTTGGDDSPSVPRPETPFLIAILSYLSGRPIGDRDHSDPAEHKALLVDRDNFDEVLAKLNPEITLRLGDSLVQLQFSWLDDFHPDQIFQQASIFARLRKLRARIADPATFPEVAEELGLQVKPSATTRAEPQRQATPVVDNVVSQLAAGSLLDSMVEETTAQHDAGRQRPRSADTLDTFVRRVTEPHLVAAEDPRQAEALATIDRVIAAQMRALLHVPVFQALETAWRSFYFLVRRVETSAQLKLFLIDISKEEIEAEFESSRDFSGTGIYRLLVEKSVGTPGADPWALIIGNYEFGPAQKAAELLGRLAKVAKAAGAPFLASASPRLLGCESLADTPHPRQWTLPPDTEGASAWAALRALPEATLAGLALPRFLLRLPYGKNTDPIESFDFEEMTQPPAHEDYLWGNPAFACALLLAQSFSEDGWDIRPGAHNQIDGLPLHVYEHDGESELTPFAEALLTDEAAEQIMEHGVMPLVSIKGQDAVRVVRFQSIAATSKAISIGMDR